MTPVAIDSSFMPFPFILILLKIWFGNFGKFYKRVTIICLKWNFVAITVSIINAQHIK